MDSGVQACNDWRVSTSQWKCSSHNRLPPLAESLGLMVKRFAASGHGLLLNHGFTSSQTLSLEMHLDHCIMVPSSPADRLNQKPCLSPRPLLFIPLLPLSALTSYHVAEIFLEPPLSLLLLLLCFVQSLHLFLVNSIFSLQ